MTLTMRRNGIAVTTHDWLADVDAIRVALRTVRRLEGRQRTQAKKVARAVRRQALKTKAA